MLAVARRPRQQRPTSNELVRLIGEAIEKGELKPGQRLGSARTLAKRWHTSYGAVRQSLEVLAARGMVERRPRAGTFISSKPTTHPVKSDAHNIIGLLVPDIRWPEYSAVARYLQDAGHRAHFEVLVSSTDNERARYDASVLRHLSAGVGGLILVSPHQARISLQTLLELEKSGIPVVNYARVIDVASWPTVQTDMFQSAYLPIQHLCQIGRKKIGFLSYPPGETHRAQVFYGLYRAISEAGLSASNVVALELPDTSYLNAWSDRSTLAQTINQWLDEHRDLDAVCCTHEHIASILLSVAAQRGISVPDDIAVTSGSLPGQFFGIAPGELTCVNTCIEKAAEEMVRILQRGRDKEAPGNATVTLIQPRLILGRSTMGSALQST